MEGLPSGNGAPASRFRTLQGQNVMDSPRAEEDPDIIRCPIEGCDREFTAFASFTGHCTRAHRLKSVLSALIKSNECLWCGSTLKDQTCVGNM